MPDRDWHRYTVLASSSCTGGFLHWHKRKWRIQSGKDLTSLKPLSMFLFSIYTVGEISNPAEFEDFLKKKWTVSNFCGSVMERQYVNQKFIKTHDIKVLGSCSWSPGLHMSQEDFWPTLLYRNSHNPVLFFVCLFVFWLPLSTLRLQLPTQILRTEVWLGHSMTLMFFFISSSFCFLDYIFESLSYWKTIQDPSSVFWLRDEGTIWWSHPVLLAE